MPDVPLISVIDDDASVRASLEALIRSLGYQVRAFESARLFLDSGVEADSDCIISDIQMPEMSGLELKEALNRFGSRTPMILMTAFDDEKVKTRSAELGVVCFLSKPFSGEGIVSCLNRALGIVAGPST